MYTLLSTIGETNVESLWLSIVGTTSLYAAHSEIYDELLPLLKEEVNRIQSTDNLTNSTTTALDASRGNRADDHSLRMDTDFGLFLLRHWNLYSSFFYSNYVNAKLQLYTNDGKKKLKTLFARMGISLASANQSWHYLDIDLRKKLESVFKKNLSKFGLTDVIREGFSRSFGFHGSISASDFVEAVTALLEHDDPNSTSLQSKESPGTPDDDAEDENGEKDIGKLIKKREAQFVNNFWKAFDSLSDFELITNDLSFLKILIPLI
ncbi:unnamed protein product [Ambrosiozyma monospora]|uniref:Unnamed protein product n=1 Tax=Ambrosiozyma monospora TaxID=43982 RepID=A0A9W6T5N3_AMBMO|nr:unnamed protein product [Ambrosiozyma monospora]